MGNFLLCTSVSPAESVFAMPPSINAERNIVEMFTCSAQGGPGNNFTWVKLSDGMVVSNESQLEINVTSAFDGSVYMCTVENNAGSDAANVTLNGEKIHELLGVRFHYVMTSPTVIPVISVPPEDKNVTSTEDLVLVCTATGFPVPDIIWIHNGSVVDAAGSDQINITEESMERQLMSNLTVTNTTFNNSGDYVCNANSSEFDPVASGPVLVLVQGQLLKLILVHTNYIPFIPFIPIFSSVVLPS